MSISDDDVINQLSKYCMECPDFGRFVLDIDFVEEVTQESTHDDHYYHYYHQVRRMIDRDLRSVLISYTANPHNEPHDLNFHLNGRMHGNIIEDQFTHLELGEVTVCRTMWVRCQSITESNLFSGLLNKSVLSEVQKRAKSYEALQ